MPKQKIMIAYDDSEHSRRALEWAVQLGRRLGSPLEIVQVLPTISYFQLLQLLLQQLLLLQPLHPALLRLQHLPSCRQSALPL